MSKNTGIPYEKLTQTIFNEIVNQDLVETIKIEHDITLQGKTTTHQIDVYWEFKVGGVEYATIVQCKDWKNTVSQEHLLTFKAVIDDLQNHPKGIFVTRTGYQSGAKQFAEKNGIDLFVLRDFTKQDEEGRVKVIELTIDAFIPFSHIVSIEHDNNWLDNFMEKKWN